jgi:hypothetical protein
VVWGLSAAVGNPGVLPNPNPVIHSLTRYSPTSQHRQPSSFLASSSSNPDARLNRPSTPNTTDTEHSEPASRDHRAEVSPDFGEALPSFGFAVVCALGVLGRGQVCVVRM